MNAQLAMEWLLEHSDDPDVDVPLTTEQLSQLLRPDAPFTVDPDVCFMTLCTLVSTY